MKGVCRLIVCENTSRSGAFFRDLNFRLHRVIPIRWDLAAVEVANRCRLRLFASRQQQRAVFPAYRRLRRQIGVQVSIPSRNRDDFKLHIAVKQVNLDGCLAAVAVRHLEGGDVAAQPLIGAGRHRIGRSARRPKAQAGRLVRPDDFLPIRPVKTVAEAFQRDPHFIRFPTQRHHVRRFGNDCCRPCLWDHSKQHDHRQQQAKCPSHFVHCLLLFPAAWQRLCQAAAIFSSW